VATIITLSHKVGDGIKRNFWLFTDEHLRQRENAV
jgi:hypothetical protein